MKSFTFLICTFLLSSNVSKAQTHSISYYEISVMYLSVSISYSGSSYSSPYFSTAKVLNTLQKRYDYYHGMVSNEWGRLENFELLNASNKVTLNNHKITIRNYFDQNNKFTHVDWAQNGQFAVELVNRISAIYNNSNIKNEISLLQSCQTELSRIKNKDPDNYLYSKRYQSIMKTLEKLKNCSTSEIQGLSWERTEIENQNNGSTTNNNNSSNNSYSSTIIGKPIIIGSLEVAENDFPKKMNWFVAVKACTDLGNGWRLPTKDELNLIYLNKDKIGGLICIHVNSYYWSSTEVNTGLEQDKYGYAWRQTFFDGNQNYGNKGNDYDYVRAVRSF